MKRPDFCPSPFFSLRTPVLPFEEQEAWTQGAEAPSSLDDEQRLRDAIGRDRERQRSRLQALVARPLVREALFLASPDLDGSLDVWYRDPESERGQRVERAVVKYVARMTSRATPFGLFAGASVGRFGLSTRLALGPLNAVRRSSRLDMGFLTALGEALARDPSYRTALRFAPNSAIWTVGDRLRYVESRQDGEDRSYHLAAIEDSPAVRFVLERSVRGAFLEDLAESLLASGVVEATPDEVAAFLEQLVDAKVLVPLLGLTLTGSEPFVGLLETLRLHPATGSVAACLEEATRVLETMDVAGPGVAPDLYRGVAARLGELPHPPDPGRLFQVDLVKSSPQATLGGPVLEEIRNGIRILHRLMVPRSSDLVAFREAFEERYGQREVPLLEALDEESGIGFPAWAGEDEARSPLIDGMPFDSGEGESQARWGSREKHLLSRLAVSWTEGIHELALDENDLRALEMPGRALLPDAFAALVRIEAPSDAALDRGDFRVIFGSAGGPSGARFLGRFCHADPELRQEVERHLRAEEALRPDVLFAEIVHLPEGRSGNVIARPLFRAYDVPFLGESGAPMENQVPVGDLVVRVRNREVELRSRRLGRRVLPRMTIAHNYVAYGLGIYRFLCSLQEQGTAWGLLWDWGGLSDTPFLPRVSVGKVVLAAARWRIGRDEIGRLAVPDPAERFRAVASLRTRLRLPRYVVLAEVGNELLVDLDSVLSVDAFVHLAGGRDGLELREMLPVPGSLCARSEDGRYVHEILLAFVREGEKALDDADRQPPTCAPPTPGARRSFAPGSEWLYVKFYGGSSSLDRILRDRLGPLAVSFTAAGVVRRWFFLRYLDPRMHLRLRFEGDPARLCSEVLPVLRAEAEALLESGEIWKMQLDTYEREVERYGGPEGIELAERLFHADSEAAAAILGLLEPGPEGEDERWRLAALGAHRLICDLGHSFSEERTLLDGLARAFRAEHGDTRALKRAIADQYRRHGRSLAALLEEDPLACGPLDPGIQLLRVRSAVATEVADALRSLRDSGRLGRTLPSLTASFVHVSLNRMFAWGQRRHETVVYEMLRLWASSRLARQEKGM